MTAAPSPASRDAPEAVSRLVARFPVLHPPVSTAGAAVTILLRAGQSAVETLLIERAANPADPASGDVALPGGRVEERDGSLTGTALRELREEVGVSTTDLVGPLHFVGATPAPRFGLHVGVFTGALSDSAGPPTIGSPEEVAHVFWLPASALAQSQLLTREMRGVPRRVFASVHEGHVVWGFTRRVLREFFDLPGEDPPDGPVWPSAHGASPDSDPGSATPPPG